MSPKHKMVSIDLEVWETLRGRAEGFDTVNKTLRRILGLPPREDQRKYNGRNRKKGVKK